MLRPGMSRREILREVIAAERRAHDVLAEAARIVSDPDDRRFFASLATADEEALRQLAREQEQLEAEEFVRQAVEV